MKSNNEPLSGQVDMREWVLAFPNLAKLLYRLARDPRVPRRNKFVLAAVAGYVVIPFDLIPDWIPGLGQLEDLALVIVALDGLLNKVPDEIIEEHWDGDPGVLNTIRDGLARVTEMVPDRIKRRVFLGSRG
jgi:uncharacterized membrane protein YkvA (DUF1232 family)